MKNRTKEPAKKNGRFWCFHKWAVAEEVGPDWDLRVGVKVSCMCTRCEKVRRIPNSFINEVPDHLINPAIRYE